MSTPLEAFDVAITPEMSPSEMSLIRAPASRTLAIKSAWRGRARMQAAGMSAAAGLQGCSMFKGLRSYGKGAVTNSIVMRSSTGTVRLIEAHHNFERKAVYGHPGR